MPLNDEIKAMFGGSNEEESPNEEGTQEFAEDTTEKSEGDQGSQNGEAEVESSSEDDSLDSRYSRLLQTFNETSAKLAEYEQTRGQKQEVPIIPQERVVETPLSATASDLSIDEKLLEKALIEDDPIAMKQVLMSIAAHVTSQKEVWRESVLRDLPMITRDVARQQVVLLNAVNKFYQDNEDLVPYQGVVGNVTNQIAAQHPEYSLGQLFEEVEKNVRKTLGLKRAAIRTEESRNSSPAFVRKANSRKPGVPKIEGIRGEIAAMRDARR